MTVSHRTFSARSFGCRAFFPGKRVDAAADTGLSACLLACSLGCLLAVRGAGWDDSKRARTCCEPKSSTPTSSIIIIIYHRLSPASIIKHRSCSPRPSHTHTHTLCDLNFGPTHSSCHCLLPLLAVVVDADFHRAYTQTHETRTFCLKQKGTFKAFGCSAKARAGVPVLDLVWSELHESSATNLC